MSAGWDMDLTYQPGYPLASPISHPAIPENYQVSS